RLQQAEPSAMIANSPAMRRALDLIHRVAPSDATVLITGEHGTGKEVTARALHALSKRAAGPLVTVDAGSIPEGVFESELFGHVKGSFTDAKSDRAGQFSLASGGTLFLDEIANVPMSQQAKLLRVLETGEVRRIGSPEPYRVDVRLVAATNANLREEVAAGRFREDLLFRLNTVEIHLPPLRERAGDIIPLAQSFLGRFAGRYRKSVTGFDAPARQALQDYAWPGNVRELNHAVERGVLMTQGAEVGVADLGLAPSEQAELRSRLDSLPLEEVEKLLIQKSLGRCDGNISQAAQALGLSRSALYRRLEKYGIRAAEE
ncbi:MAG: sigma-54 interaction domain-containing protein, partial [Terriglobia bacterium]